MKENRKYLTTTQAAKLLSVSPDTVLKWIKAGKLRSKRTLGGHFRISIEQLKSVSSEIYGDSAPETGEPGSKSWLYCWEHLAGSGEIKSECRECITYRSRAKRCYELRDLPDGLGCLRLYCRSDCIDCEYYQLVREQGINVLIFTENRDGLVQEQDIGIDDGMEVRFSGNEYECAVLIDNFSPDYIVVDCSIGKKRTYSICEHFFNDSRIPVARIILASKIRNLQEYCDKEVFGWIKKPFTADQLTSCIHGTNRMKS